MISNKTYPPSAPRPPGSLARLDELFRRWVAGLNLQSKSSETYACAVRQFLRWLHERGITADPKLEDVLAYRNFIVKTKQPTTAQIYTTALRLFFKWLEAGDVCNNIAKHIKGVEVKRHHKKDYLTVEQVKNVFGKIELRSERDCRDYAILSLMITCGLRDTEVCQSNIGDIGRVGESAVLYLRGKGQEERADYVKLTESAKEAIDKYLRERGAHEPSAPLFTSISRNSRGGRLSIRSVSRIAKERLQAAGYDSDKLSAHSFRHSAVALALLGGLSLEEAQQFARHGNITSTLTYARNLARVGSMGRGGGEVIKEGKNEI